MAHILISQKERNRISDEHWLTSSGTSKELLISLNHACQYRCTFCVYLKKKHKKTLPLPVWLSLLDKAHAAGFRLLEIGGQGEPSLFKGLKDIVQHARKLGFGIKLLSNVQSKAAVLDVLPQLDWLTINMNTLTPKEFREVHAPIGRISFRQTLANIAAVVQEIEKNGLRTRLNINYVVNKESFIRGLSFPRLLFDILRRRFKVRHPIYVQYHHMLIVPGNYELCPDRQGLEDILETFEKSAGEPFLRKHTDIIEFIKRTREQLFLYRLVGPFCSDSPRASRSSEAAKKLREHVWCEACRKALFVDCNGDAFGCYNPTRIIYGFPKKKDALYYGNIRFTPWSELMRKSTRAENCHVDLTKRFWKACAVCGLRMKDTLRRV